MAITRGRDVKIQIAGAGLSLTNEACTEVSNTVFQITNAVKQVLDPQATITVKVNTVVVATTTYSLDRLQGKITFTGSQHLNTVTVTGTYLPMSELINCTQNKVSLKGSNVDASTLNGGAFVARKQTLKDVSGSLMKFNVVDNVYGDALVSEAQLVFEEDYSGSLHCRAWALMDSDDLESVAAGLATESINWVGFPDADGNVVSFA